MKKNRFVLILIPWITLWLQSCSCRHEPKIPLDRIDVEVKIQRFDHDLFSINTDSIETEVPRLHASYGAFFELFCNRVIGIGLPEDSGFADYLYSFINDNMVSETYRSVQNTYPDTKELDKILTDAFKRFRYYFPDRFIPPIYGFVSGFNVSVVLADSMLGVGFDRYLGRQCEYYPQLGIHKYLTYNMHSKKIPSDLIRAWGLGEFQFSDSVDNLLNNMIYEGKLVYFTKRLLPDEPDSLILGFTPNQMKWCRNNESQMWTHLVEHKLLFNTEQFTINQFIGDAPFTQGFTQESPGKAAVWLGYRIVSKYMEKNKRCTLYDLMKEDNYQQILTLSLYNP